MGKVSNFITYPDYYHEKNPIISPHESMLSSRLNRMASTTAAGDSAAAVPKPRYKCFRRPSTLIILLLLSAIPLATLVSLELSAPPSSYRYASHGWLRECAKWDAPARRFLISTFLSGDIAEVAVVPGGAGVLEERTWISDGDVAGNASLGLTVDRRRGRVVVVYGDPRRFRYSAAAAYNLDSGERLFLTRLSGPDEDRSFADDVAVDEEGNAYITDCMANKIWKLGPKGELLSVIRSKAFVQRKEWYYNFVGLNGIVYNPNGYLLVIHTSTGFLFKVDIAKEVVSVVKVKGSLFMGDGLELLSPTRLVVAGTPSARIVESSDNWVTATVTERYVGPLHRVATSATVKDGKVYLSHLLGGGLTKWTHLIAEAVFTPLIAK